VTRVLHVISGLGTGGAESFLVALAAQLQTRGFDQQVVSVTRGGQNADKLTALDIPVAELGVKGLASAMTSYGAMRAAVSPFDPHIIQGWMYHGDLFATFMQAVFARRARLMWNIRCSDMRLEDYSPQLRLVVKACARLSGRPEIVLANSRAGGKVHMAAGYRPRRMEIIPNGIDVARFRPDAHTRAQVRAEFGIPSEMPVILHVARVDPMKDHRTFLTAVEDLEGIRVLLVGKGTETLGRPPHIIGLGERRDVPRLLAAGDIIVSSSAYGEGFSNAIAEGMASGLLPVTTDVGDAREIVGSTGDVVPIADAHALRRALQRLLGLTRQERHGMGLAARARIEENFSLEKASDRFAALYRESPPAVA
jgi:glycosyltransferase involved in cell wall biosynthesis